MYLENTTDENIFIATGIFVPARATLTVQPEMHSMVTTSPLIADYVTAGDLVLHGAEKAEEPAPATAPPAPAKAKDLEEK